MLSNRVALDSYPFANPLNNSVTVTQSNGGVALDPHDSRLTQVSYLDGMLWTGTLLSAVSEKGSQAYLTDQEGRSLRYCYSNALNLRDCALRCNHALMLYD